MFVQIVNLYNVLTTMCGNSKCLSPYSPAYQEGAEEIQHKYIRCLNIHTFLTNKKPDLTLSSSSNPSLNSTHWVDAQCLRKSANLLRRAVCEGSVLFSYIPYPMGELNFLLLSVK